MAPKKMPPYFQGMNKTQLRKAVRAIVNPRGFDEEFESELLSDMIATKHYYCSVHNLRPVRFRKRRRHGPGYDFEARFEGHGWHGVSWDQCITPKPDDIVVKGALRRAIKPLTARYRENHAVCERCGQRASVDCHHVEPTFDQMAAAGMERMRPEDWTSLWRAFDWWDQMPSLSPQNHRSFGTCWTRTPPHA